MSRKRKAPKKLTVVDPKYKSSIIPKLINSIMYDGKKTIAEKIIYDAIDKLNNKLEKHIDYIDNTYEGLRNPIEGVKKFLGK